MKALILGAAIVLAACSGAAAPSVAPAGVAAPTAIVAPSLAPTVAPTPTLKPTATPAPAAKLEVVPCTFDLTKDQNCQNQSYHVVTNGLTVGSAVTLAFTLRNSGTKASGPVSAVLMGCSEFGGCSNSQFYLPDRFAFLSCSPSCTGRITTERTTLEVDWAGKIKPGAAMTLSVRLRATSVGYNYIMTALYAASSKQWDASMANDAGTAIAATKLGEWDNMQIVVNQR